MTSTMTAYHADPALKAATLAQLAEHRRLDQIVRGTYWDGSRGCAVGCLTHQGDGGHEEFPSRWGVPVQIAHLIDTIFERLPIDQAQEWPSRIMDAIPVGADLSRTWDRFAAWMLGHVVAQYAEAGAALDPSVAAMAALFVRAGAGDEPSETEWIGQARAAHEAWKINLGASRAAWAARAAWKAGVSRVAWAFPVRADVAAGSASTALPEWGARVAWAARAADELVRLVSMGTNDTEGAK